MRRQLPFARRRSSGTTPRRCSAVRRSPAPAAWSCGGHTSSSPARSRGMGRHSKGDPVKGDPVRRYLAVGHRQKPVTELGVVCFPSGRGADRDDEAQATATHMDVDGTAGPAQAAADADILDPCGSTGRRCATGVVTAVVGPVAHPRATVDTMQASTRAIRCGSVLAPPASCFGGYAPADPMVTPLPATRPRSRPRPRPVALAADVGMIAGPLAGRRTGLRPSQFADEQLTNEQQERRRGTLRGERADVGERLDHPGRGMRAPGS